MKEQKGIDVKRLTLENITKEVVLGFLDFIQNNRQCSKAARNCRLATLRY